jgi:hypothetical protein
MVEQVFHTTVFGNLRLQKRLLLLATQVLA